MTCICVRPACAASGRALVCHSRLTHPPPCFALSSQSLALAAPSASKSAPSSGSPSSHAGSGSSESARVIRDRAAARDKKIAEKQAKKAAEKEEKESAAKAAAEQEKENTTKAAEKEKSKEKAATPKATKPTTKPASSASDPSTTAAKPAASKPKATPRSSSRAASTDSGEITLERKRERLAASRHAAAQRKRLSAEKARRRASELLKKRRDRAARRAERLKSRQQTEDVRRRRRLESTKPEIVARGVEKLKWFERQVTARSPMVDISYSNLKKYVHATPRPYWLFVSLTALGERYSCQICRTVAPEMKQLAQLYREDQLQLDASRIGNSSFIMLNETDFANEREFDQYRRSMMPIFFVQADIDSNSELFRQLNLQTAPTLFVMSPTAAATPTPIAQMLSSLPAKNRYQLMRNDISAADLNEFVQKVTGRSVSLTKPREPGLQGIISLVSDLLNLMDPVRFLILCVAAAMICLLLVLWSAQRAWRAFRRFQSKRSRQVGVVTRDLTPAELAPLRIYSQYSSDLLSQSVGTPSLTRSCFGVVSPGAFQKPRSLGLFRWWFIVAAFIVFVFGISGGMFNILRGNSEFPLAALLRSPLTFDLMSHIHLDNSHDQSVLEGFALGVMQIMLATILIFLNRVAFTERVVRAEGAAPVTARERATRVAQWLRDCLYSPLIWATLFFLTWRLILTIYSRKNGSYRFGFVWKHLQPAHFAVVGKYARAAIAMLPKGVAKVVLKWIM